MSIPHNGVPTPVIAHAVERAHLHPEMQVGMIERPGLADALSGQVGQIQELAFPPASIPPDSFDALFAPLELLQAAANLPAAIQELTLLLRPGGRLVLLAGVSPLEAGRLHPSLRAAGLVNLLLFDTGLQPAHSPHTAVALAVGARPVAGVHAAVQHGYGARAAGQAAAGACCTSAAEQPCCSTGSGFISPLDIGYTQIELQAAPPEAAEIALGCGNPTAFAHLRPGEVVLDIGSGGGLDSMLAARAVGPTGQVIGVDMTPAMLTRARQSAERAGYAWIEYRQGQAEALPLTDDRVDVAMSNCVINLSPDKGRVFAEIFRVLRPGGRLEISDMVAGGALPAALSADADQWAGCVAGALPESEYLALIAQAGFEAITPRRSPSGETYGGVPVYSLAVSARKPA